MISGLPKRAVTGSSTGLSSILAARSAEAVSSAPTSAEKGIVVWWSEVCVSWRARYGDERPMKPF